MLGIVAQHLFLIAEILIVLILYSKQFMGTTEKQLLNLT